jgi:hypothetical protein
LPDLTKQKEPIFTGLAAVKIMPFLTNRFDRVPKTLSQDRHKKAGALNVAVVNLLIPLANGRWRGARIVSSHIVSFQL